MKEYQDLKAAFTEVDWENLLPRLAAYADRKLFWSGWGIRRSRPSAYDLVNQAIERCLSNERKWAMGTSCDLEGFLRGVIKSLVNSAKKAAVRQIGELPTATSAPLTANVPDGGEFDVSDSDICAATATCSEGDADLEAYYLAVLDEDRREDVASRLGWSAARVSAARTKLQRRLLSQFPELFSGLKKKRVA